MTFDQSDGDRDDAIGQQLRALLAVDPSPDFVARVRTRMHADAGRRSRWWAIAVLAAPAMAALLFAAVMFGRPRTFAPALRPPLDARLTAIVAAPALDLRVPSVTPAADTTEQSSSPPHRRVTAVGTGSAVVVSMSEMQALQNYVDDVRRQRAAPVLAVAVSLDAVEGIADIRVAAIEIAPIAVPALREFTP